MASNKYQHETKLIHCKVNDHSEADLTDNSPILMTCSTQLQLSWAATNTERLHWQVAQSSNITQSRVNVSLIHHSISAQSYDSSCLHTNDVCKWALVWFQCIKLNEEASLLFTVNNSHCTYYQSSQTAASYTYFLCKLYSISNNLSVPRNYALVST